MPVSPYRTSLFLAEGCFHRFLFQYANQSHNFRNWIYCVVTLHFSIKLLSFLTFYLPICFSFFFVCLFVCFFPETNLPTYCYADNNSTVDHLDYQFLKYNQRRDDKLSKEAQESNITLK